MPEARLASYSRVDANPRERSRRDSRRRVLGLCHSGEVEWCIDVVGGTDPRVRRTVAIYLDEVSQRLGLAEAVHVEPDELAEYTPPHGAFVLLRTRDDVHPRGGAGIRRLDESRAELKRLWIDPMVRGHGAGRTLLDAAVGEARALGFRALYLDSHFALTEARQLYLSAGFEDAERYNDNPHAQYWMVKPLHDELSA